MLCGWAERKKERLAEPAGTINPVLKIPVMFSCGVAHRFKMETKAARAPRVQLLSALTRKYDNILSILIDHRVFWSLTENTEGTEFWSGLLIGQSRLKSHPAFAEVYPVRAWVLFWFFLSKNQNKKFVSAISVSSSDLCIAERVGEITKWEITEKYVTLFTKQCTKFHPLSIHNYSL